MKNKIIKTDGDNLVLVTGGSGFVGVHCILQLINAGYRVRTTVRSLERETDVRAMLKTGGIEAVDALSFVAADLITDDGWQQAVSGCDYVLHVASPFPSGTSKNADDVIIPAREGALRVLRAARDAGVKRVVLTSSFAAIGYGHKSDDKPFSEENWTNLDNPHLSAYVKSKTIAERAAWDFIEREGGALELSVINPVGIFGPALGTDFSGSIQIIENMMKGALSQLPNIYFSLIDVRDVAYLHLRAMTDPAARGQRFLAAGDSTSLLEIANTLKARMGDAAARVSTKTLPSWIIRVSSIFSTQAKEIVHDIDKIRGANNAKVRQVFDWTPISNEKAIVATAESLIRLGALRNKNMNDV